MVWTSRPVRRLSGTIRAPGDKACSHRALIFGVLASGTSRFAAQSPPPTTFPARPTATLTFDCGCRKYDW